MSKYRVVKKAEDLFTVQEQKSVDGEWTDRTHHGSIECAKSDIESFKSPKPEAGVVEFTEEVVYED